MIRKILIHVFASVLLIPQLLAQTQPDALPPQSTAIKGVLLPVPREIFDTLDQFEHSNWRAVQRPEVAQWRPRGGQVDTALLLGVVIAEGFVAVEAQDADEVKRVGTAVLRLARGLGVEKAALKRSRSIIEHAESGDWTGVRKEWDGVLPDVQKGMNELQSAQLAQLVSLGGWLRGADVITTLVLQSYSGKNAEFLRQPALVEHFEKRLAEMSGQKKNSRMIIEIREGMQKIRPLILSDAASISEARVKEVSGVSRDLLKSLGR